MIVDVEISSLSRVAVDSYHRRATHCCRFYRSVSLSTTRDSLEADVVLFSIVSILPFASSRNST